MHCQAHVAQLRDDRERFEASGARLVLVTLSSPSRTKGFCEEREVPFVCLSDPSKRSYGAFGLERGGLRDLYSPRTVTRGLHAWRHGARTSVKLGEDVWQMPGTFVIDREGVVRYAHRNHDVADTPSNDEVLAAVETLGSR